LNQLKKYYDHNSGKAIRGMRAADRPFVEQGSPSSRIAREPDKNIPGQRGFPPLTRYDLYQIMKEELHSDSSDLVTRPSGQAVRKRIECELEKEEHGAVVALDFSKIGIVDYSCADEIVAKLVSRLISDEYGNRYIVLSGLNENQKENIEVALERKDLSVMAQLRKGKKILLGSLNNYLKETLQFVLDNDKTTAKDLSDALGIEANTSGTRLLNLHKKRLVRRVDTIRDGGRVWVYERT